MDCVIALIAFFGIVIFEKKMSPSDINFTPNYANITNNNDKKKPFTEFFIYMKLIIILKVIR